MKVSYLSKGFTLIELLVVISIIGILASLALASYSGAQKQTRDTQRRSDLNQYRNALESYAASNGGVYPADTSGDVSAICGTGKALEEFIASCPEDPIGDGYLYKYYSADGREYTLWGKLETTGKYWKICSNGKSGNSGTDSSECDVE